MQAKYYAVMAEMPGYSDCHVLAIVKGRRELFAALRIEASLGWDYWVKRKNPMKDLTEYGGPYRANAQDSEWLNVWVITQQEAEEMANWD